MSTEPSIIEKIEKPATHFSDAHEVVADPTLTEDQKREALETLEQDARQLAIASSEGMNGGEPTGLHEVLAAKDVIDLAPVDQAYKTVQHSLETRLALAEGEDRVVIEAAMAGLRAVAALPGSAA